MVKNVLKLAAAILAINLATISAAQAISFTYSDKTKKSAVIFDLESNINLPFNLAVLAGIEAIPSYSSIVGPIPSGIGEERLSFLGNIGANLGYNFNLFNAETVVGNFTPTLTPYLGYKHYLAHTTSGGLSLSGLTPTTSFSNVGGPNFGVRFTTQIPLGFSVFADAGATSLLNGSWSQSNPDTKGEIISGGLLLPHFGAGASWNIFNLITARAGYKFLFVPDIRTPNAPLTGDSKAGVHSLDIGLSFLFFSI